MADVLGEGFESQPPTMYALSAVVYAERDGRIVLLKRSEGSALAGQWFLPGGMVEAGERPEDGARRELLEESGLRIDGDLELVGAYPMWVYGRDCLQLSYRGRVREGDVALSDEHEGEMWVSPADMLLLLTDEVIESIAKGDDRVTELVRNIRSDLELYIRRLECDIDRT